MQCPYCGHTDSRVTDSRDTGQEIRRRRECVRCGLRFTTYERVQSTALLVRKRDGRREPFNREKVRAGLLKACAKRPVSPEAVDKAVDDLERQLAELGRAEVPSQVIGEMVLEHLKHLDPVAYLRFASVYLNFPDLETFRREVEKLLSAQRQTPGVSQPSLIPVPQGAQGQRRRGRPPKSQASLLRFNNRTGG